MQKELRAKLVAAANEWNDPDHPRHSKPEEFQAKSLAEHQKEGEPAVLEPIKERLGPMQSLSDAGEQASA
ncbi:MAG: hypothetical protein H0T52_08245, partial [Lautropia sp.]|nr:hypothetical protein [Lautropia sp.]